MYGTVYYLWFNVLATAAPASRDMFRATVPADQGCFETSLWMHLTDDARCLDECRWEELEGSIPAGVEGYL